MSRGEGNIKSPSLVMKVGPTVKDLDLLMKLSLRLPMQQNTVLPTLPSNIKRSLLHDRENVISSVQFEYTVRKFLSNATKKVP